MTQSEMVTTFKLRQDWYETPLGTFGYRSEAEAACKANDLDPALCVKHTIEMATVEATVEAINAHCKAAGVEAEEYSFCVSPQIQYERPGETLPQKWAYLIAYAIEGSSEGYYVHVGVILKAEGLVPPTYLDFGFAKTYSADNAYALAREAQRFLTAGGWN